MDYLVTGATGFIGRKLVGQLLALGHEVNYLGRQRDKTLDSRIAFHFWNPEQLPPLDSISRLDAIIHLAGEPVMQRWNHDSKRRMYESRIDSTHQIVSTIAKLQHKPSVLVCASAAGYYGNRGDELLPETASPGNDFLAKLCIDWEHEAARARELGLRVASIRIPIVLGTEGGALKQMLPPFRLGLGGPFGDGRQWMPWVHVDDLVRLLIHAAENPVVSGALNGNTPHAVTNAEFAKTLARALHRPAILPVPKFALKLAFGEMADFLVASQHMVPEATQRTGFTYLHSELRPALDSLLHST